VKHLPVILDGKECFSETIAFHKAQSEKYARFATEHKGDEESYNFYWREAVWERYQVFVLRNQKGHYLRPVPEEVQLNLF